ncbi:hypothetical protein [Pantoea ananatis]|uniref:hypothetical protein n=1 Tax=Pantoea ananas TaxID=553 RepID=UPI000E256309|nr:hypothetical protein [Pantoea ananatis]REF11476.1 hypothetical protein C7428_0675 [Pantoea ananatis]
MTDIQKSPELLAKEAQAAGLASAARAVYEPAPVDTVTYREQFDPATGRSKLIPVKQLDTDSALADKLQSLAEAQNLSIAANAETEEDDRQKTFDQLFPSDQRRMVEEFWTPIITKLIKEHQTTCDDVEHFESSEGVFRARLQAEFAFHLKHPDIKTLQVAGDYHFNTLLANGSLDIEGYKLVERRSNGGGIQLVNGALAPAQGSFTLVYVPIGVANVLSYAQSPEALAASKHEYGYQLNRLITKRKAVAVQLAQAKQKARDQLSTITSFDQLISDAVKRAKK